MTLSKERKGEIAVQILQHIFNRKGLRLNLKTREDIAKEAQRCGIPAEEAVTLVRELVIE